MQYTIVSQLPRNAVGAVWWHIRVGTTHRDYIVSANVVRHSGPEVMVFPADYDGKVTDFGDIVCVRGSLDHKEAIAELLEHLAEEEEEEEETPNTISESDAYARYDEMVNELHETVKCGYLEWDMSRVLKEMDPTAYQCGLNDWLDSEGLELE